MSKKKLAGIIGGCIIAIIVVIVLINFKPWERTYTLSISVDPPQAGSVSPLGGEYESGEQVTLTASSVNRYTFDYWSGSASENTSTITINMGSDKSLTAHFRVTYPIPGDWVASTRSSEFTFNFTVNSDGTGISKYTLEFEELFCGGVQVDGMTSHLPSSEPIPIHPLPNGEFSLVHDMWPAIEIVIEGNFDETGTHASGTWGINSEGIICEEGTWQVSR